MSKTLYGHRIGANVHEAEAPTGVKLVPDNKTLIAMPFNDEHDEEIDPKRLKSLKEIFAHYKPSREVVLKKEDGESEEKIFQFKNMKDFTKDGIIEQSEVLQELQEKEAIYSRFYDVLQNNDSLRQILGNPENKKEFQELLETLIEELKESEQ